MSSSVDIPAERMVAQISEFTEAERRFRRYRCLMVAFFVILLLSLLVYLLLTWELSEEGDEEEEPVQRNSMTFTTILTVSICSLAAVSVSSFIALEFIRRKSIRQLVESQNQEMRSYFEERRYGTMGMPHPPPSSSDRSSWVIAPPGSEASSPPPAYDECVERA